MERLGDILKKIKRNIPDDNVDDLLNINVEPDSHEPVCSICRGAKFVHPLLESGRPDYRRVIPCKCAQQEIEKDRYQNLQKYSNLGSLSRLTFEKLSPEGRKFEGNFLFEFKPVYEAALEFAYDPQGWLVITGPSGSGKTHLACAIANYQLSHSRPAFYIEASDLLDHIRSTFYPDSNVSYDELFEQIKNTPLLIIDNLNIPSWTPWAKEKFAQIFNYRFNERLPMVITSNITVKELEKNLDCHLTDPDLCKIFSIKSKSDREVNHFGGLELEMIKTMTFDNFDRRSGLNPEERQNLDTVYKGAFNFAKLPEGWLVLHGQNGCGKTHLAAAIANYLHAHGKEVLFVIVPDFLDHLRSTFSPESNISYDSLFERVKNIQVLILDDYDEQAITSWTQEKLYQLINYRYNAKLATVITTSYQSFDDIESRICSRMLDHNLSLVLNIEAPDYRADRKPGGRNIGTKYRKG